MTHAGTDPSLHWRRVGIDALGYLAYHEGIALFDYAAAYGHLGPVVEIGSYCGKSTCFLGAGARSAGTVVYAVDHHRGSEVMRNGQPLFDARLTDSDGSFYTLPMFVATIAAAGLSDVVTPIVTTSLEAAEVLDGPFGMVFIDGEHDEQSVRDDWRAWSPLVAVGGVVAFHDVNDTDAPDAAGPIRVWQHDVEPDPCWETVGRVLSLSVARRVA